MFQGSRGTTSILANRCGASGQQHQGEGWHTTCEACEACDH